MLDSKEILARTGISRATLNNYVARGLLPRPVVMNPGGEGGGPRQLGYFPDDAVEIVLRVKKMRDQGVSMDRIKETLSVVTGRSEERADERAPQAGASGDIAHPPKEPGPLPEREHISLNIERIPYPAYMVNYNFELIWCNQKGKAVLLDPETGFPPNAADRNIFRIITGRAGALQQDVDNLLEICTILAKVKLNRQSLMTLCQGLDPEHLAAIDNFFAESRAATPEPIMDIDTVLRLDAAEPRDYRVYALFLREGIFFLFVPLEHASDSFMHLLARRDTIVRELLSKRLPVLTQLAVLVADLQDSVKICSELPPEEYFELINQIWSTVGPIFRKYYGTHGKHSGDGMIYFFFPRPDSDYIENSLDCAYEVKGAISRIGKEWQLRKNWSNELYLNIGLNEGQEWVGTYQTESNVELAVLGETINHTARLSDFARFGAIWATKNFICKLTPEARKTVQFGIRREEPPGRHILVESSYSRVSNLIDLANPKYEKLRDISGLVIAEVVGVAH